MRSSVSHFLTHDLLLLLLQKQIIGSKPDDAYGPPRALKSVSDFHPAIDAADASESNLGSERERATAKKALDVAREPSAMHGRLTPKMHVNGTNL